MDSNCGMSARKTCRANMTHCSSLLRQRSIVGANSSAFLPPTLFGVWSTNSTRGVRSISSMSPVSPVFRQPRCSNRTLMRSKDRTHSEASSMVSTRSESKNRIKARFSSPASDIMARESIASSSTRSKKAFE